MAITSCSTIHWSFKRIVLVPGTLASSVSHTPLHVSRFFFCKLHNGEVNVYTQKPFASRLDNLVDGERQRLIPCKEQDSRGANMSSLASKLVKDRQFSSNGVLASIVVF